MQKAIFLLFFLLLPSRQVTAQELPLEEFHQKLKGLYYDYKKEGLKGFHCDIKSALLEKMIADSLSTSGAKPGLELDILKAMFNSKYELDYDLMMVKIFPKRRIRYSKDDQGLGKAEERTKKLLEMEIQTWISLVTPGEAKPRQDEIKFTRALKTLQGYELFAANTDSHCVFHFDPNYRLNCLIYQQKNDKPVTLNTDYEKTPKGWRIRSCDLTYGSTSYKAKVFYQTVDDYYVPSAIAITLTGKRKDESFFDTLTFDNYNIDW